MHHKISRTDVQGRPHTRGRRLLATAPVVGLLACGLGAVAASPASAFNGRPAGPRWRWMTRTLVVSTVVGTVALASLSARAPEAVRGRATVTPGLDTVALLGSIAVLVVGSALAIARLAVRIARASAAQRPLLQCAAANAVLLLVALLLDTFGGVPLVWLFGALAVPTAAVIGVVRYGSTTSTPWSTGRSPTVSPAPPCSPSTRWLCWRSVSWCRSRWSWWPRLSPWSRCCRCGTASSGSSTAACTA